jgi:glycosyltransferase involved in cell wall biosynthesis
VTAAGGTVRLSAVVVAQDEEAMLPDCLASLRFCDEVLVIDGGSRDRTREAATAGGARVIERAFDHFSAQHEFAREQARGSWVLSIDADERVTPELARRAREIADAPPDQPGPVAWAIPFKNHFRGVWLRHGGLWPDRHLRLFRRDRCRYDPALRVHEKLLVHGPLGELEAPVLHYSWSSLAHCLRKSERYAEQAALALHQQGERATAFDLVLRPLWRLLRGYVLRLGFLDGQAGAVVAFARAYELYARSARLWELSRFPDAQKDPLR